MIPDPATVAGRRHSVTIVVRFLIAAYGAWCFYALGAGSIAGFFGQLLNSFSVDWNAFANLIRGICYMLPEFALLVLFIVLEPRIVRWIVPMPARDGGCPKCGYSLKDLKSPICPECGTNLR